MKVSIIIPVYNVAPYIKRCLDSIVAQTFQNIECILVDDCGTDNSKEIVQQYIDNYQGYIQFKIIHHEKNLGLSGARNTGIRIATGEWLYFLDSDDAVTPNCISSLLALKDKYPDVDFVQGNLLDENGEISHYGFNNIPEYCTLYHKRKALFAFLQKMVQQMHRSKGRAFATLIAFVLP